MIKHRIASFQEAEFVNPSCTLRYKKMTQRSSIRTSSLKSPTMQVQTMTTAATDPEMMYVRTHTKSPGNSRQTLQDIIKQKWLLEGTMKDKDTDCKSQPKHDLVAKGYA
ncbi:hypothetical protein Tco_0793846 [Tanacetum coccineum]